MKQSTNHTITFERQSTELFVQVSFELKDLFKKVFRNARWDAASKKWIISAKSEERLVTFIEETKNFTEELNKREELNLVENEILEIREEIKRQRIYFNTAKASNEKIQQSVAILEAHKKELAELKSEVQEAKDEKDATFAEAKKLLENTIDIDSVLAAKEEMRRNHKAKTSLAREKFDNAQTLIAKQRDLLRAKSLESVGLRKLSWINFNRPDRDNVDDISMTDILTIVEHEQAE